MSYFIFQIKCVEFLIPRSSTLTLCFLLLLLHIRMNHRI
nr:MAG TPA: hypothetical protein [Caudoviricetes sp.]